MSELRLIRMKDPNEALGLAVRLVATARTFRDMPLGLSMQALIEAVDSDSYAFAARSGRALGVACWRLTTQAAAEAWLARDGPGVEPSETPDGRVAIMLAVQGTDAEVIRFLMRQLRDGPMRSVQLLYYMRDYGTGKSARLVRLRRPKSRMTRI